MTIGFLDACGMNTPHTHPRATEINFSVNTTLRAGFLMENGARFVDVELKAGSAAVFPQGAIHFEMNPSCEPAMFVASFNNEDPGVGQLAQRCESRFSELSFQFIFTPIQTSAFPLTLLVFLWEDWALRRSTDSSL